MIDEVPITANHCAYHHRPLYCFSLFWTSKLASTTVPFCKPFFRFFSPNFAITDTRDPNTMQERYVLCASPTLCLFPKWQSWWYRWKKGDCVSTHKVQYQLWYVRNVWIYSILHQLKMPKSCWNRIKIQQKEIKSKTIPNLFRLGYRYHVHMYVICFNIKGCRIR